MKENTVKYFVLICAIALAHLDVSAQLYRVRNTQKVDVYLTSNNKNEKTETIVMEDGKVYSIQKDVTIDMRDNGQTIGAALKVNDGATAVLNIPKGYTLTLYGSNGVDTTKITKPGYPGVEIPETSKLIVTGGGKIKAYGGQNSLGHVGADGGDGKAGCCEWGPWYWSGSHETPGSGGDGGCGGSGGAPGIGSRGGYGGRGGEAVVVKGYIMHHDYKWKQTYEDVSDVNGVDGSDGEAAPKMGKLVLIGNVVVEAARGESVVWRNDVGAAGNPAWERHSNSAHYAYFAGCGGAGGTGGLGGVANYGIGAGAPGAGGGGSGSSGRTSHKYYSSNIEQGNGYGGHGGEGYGYNGANGREDANHTKITTNPGKGGRAASFHDGDGVIYCTPTSQCNARYNAGKGYFMSMDSMTLEQVRGAVPDFVCNSISFEKLPDDSPKMPEDFRIFYGMPMNNTFPDVPVQNDKGTAKFAGYYDQFGNRIYDDKGKVHPLAVGKDHQSLYITPDSLCFINFDEDLVLSPRWEDSVTVVVAHYLDDPDYATSPYGKDAYHNHFPDVHEIRKYAAIFGGESDSLKIYAYKDLDGKAIDELNPDWIKKIGATDTVIKLDSLGKYVEFCYTRNTYKFSYDLSGVSEPDSVWSRSTKPYTPAGTLKYGQTIVRPTIHQAKGRYIKAWEPVDVVHMTHEDLVLKAVEADTTYYIQKEVHQNGTKGDIHISKMDSVRYNQPIRVTIDADEDTYLESLMLIRKDTTMAEMNHFQRVSDKEYLFNMIDENAIVKAVFGQRSFSVTALTNIEETRISITPDFKTYYTDHNDYYQYPDSIYGGGLKDFPFSRGQRRMYVSADFGKPSSTAWRPIIRMGSASGHDKNPTIVVHHDSKRLRKFYAYTVDADENLDIKVVWQSKVGKKVLFKEGVIDQPISIENVGRDDNEHIYIDSVKGAVAYGGDYVWFTVKTDDPSFGPDNISASYVDVHGDTCFMIIKDLNPDYKSKKVGFGFTMPERDVTVILNTGKKQPITVETPKNPDGESYYQIFHADSAVVGSLTPIFVEYHNDSTDVTKKWPVTGPLNPEAVYGEGTAESPEQYVYATKLRRIVLRSLNSYYSYDTRAFVMPDAPVTLKHGYKREPAQNEDMESRFFTFYAEEPVEIPAGLDVYTVSSTKYENLELKLDNSILPARTPVLINAHNGKRYFFKGRPDLVTDSVTQDNILIGVPIKTLVKSIIIKHQLTEDQGVNIVDIEEDYSTPLWYVADPDDILPANSAFSIYNYDQSYNSHDKTAIQSVNDNVVTGLPDGKYFQRGNIIIIRNGQLYNAIGTKVIR